jgi:hypothetical protein
VNRVSVVNRRILAKSVPNCTIGKFSLGGFVFKRNRCDGLFVVLCVRFKKTAAKKIRMDCRAPKKDENQNPENSAAIIV